MDLQKVLDVITEAAVYGGTGALAKQGFSRITADDGGGGLTTEQDALSQKTIVDILEEKLPEINILAEEKTEKSVTEENLIVDPIDGSVDYHRLGRGWSTTIAYTEDFRVTAGVICQPRNNILVTGMQGGKLSIMEGDKKMKILPIPSPFDLSKSVIQMPVSGGDFSTEVVEKVQNPLTKASRFIRNTHVNTNSIIELLIGQCDSFIGYGSIWDFAAGMLFVEMAGGVVTDYHGNPVNMKIISPQRVVFSRSQEIHDQIIPFTRNWPSPENELRKR